MKTAAGAGRAATGAPTAQLVIIVGCQGLVMLGLRAVSRRRLTPAHGEPGMDARRAPVRVRGSHESLLDVPQARRARLFGLLDVYQRAI